MRILIADEDPVFLDFTRSLLELRREYSVATVRDGEEALKQVMEAPPQALFVNQHMPRLSGHEICRALRRESPNPDAYVAMLSPAGGMAALAEGLDAGADDVIPKPVPPDVFVAHVELARRHAPGAAAGLMKMHHALWRAQAQGSGELVVVNDRTSARVLFYEGRVAWTHLSDQPSPFLRMLSVQLEVEEEVLREVIEECRRTGQRLTETISRWGLVDADRLRAGIRDWMSQSLAAILRLSRVRTLFVPQHRRYADNLLFTLEELGIPRVPSAQPRSSQSLGAGATAVESFPIRGFMMKVEEPPTLSGLLDQCAALEGVVGVAALARNTGCCLGLRGDELDPDALWACASLLDRTRRLGLIEDGVITTQDRYHIVRPAPHLDDLFLYVVVDANVTTLAMACVHLRRLTAHIA